MKKNIKRIFKPFIIAMKKNIKRILKLFIIALYNLLFVFTIWFLEKTQSYKYRPYRLLDNRHIEIYLYKLKNKNLKKKNSIDDSISIIIAGPYVSKADFTLNNVISTRQKYPKSEIILSTNSVLNEKNISTLNDLRVKILHANKLSNEFQKELDNFGNINMLYQIDNIQKALKLCKNEYILRQRTDQIILSDYYIESFINTLNVYDKDSKRLITLSNNVFANKFLSISDMLHFGTKTNIQKYWGININSIKEIYIKFKGSSHELMKTLGTSPVGTSPEPILAFNFYQNLYDSEPQTNNDYNKLLKNNFIILDKESIQLFWKKNSIVRTYKQERGLITINHIDWINIFNGTHTIQDIITHSRFID